MNLEPFTSRDIVDRRPSRMKVDPWRPVDMFIESEFSRSRRVERVATVLLANRECAFRCLMCDLWKQTFVEPTPLGAIPAQIDHALSRLESARLVKLYNSGNFFDSAAIPPADHRAIAERLVKFETVIVENHPKLCGRVCVEFRKLLGSGELEVAMGLETVHEPTLRLLNKQMTRDDFRRAAEQLRAEGIFVRAFVLLRAPAMSEMEGVDWALRSVEFAFDSGADVVSIIATRGGNGIMDLLASQGVFSPPRLDSLEQVIETALGWDRGRVFADLWRIEGLSACPDCRARREERLSMMNLTQRIPPRVECACA